ncbi:MAG TPA: DUF481 domain-containing protein, partial [Acidobacteriaceae bacterium]
MSLALLGVVCTTGAVRMAVAEDKPKPAGAQDKAKPGAAQDKAKPEPDVILFTNGDQLSGTLLRGVGDSVVFKSDVAGEITVPLAKIKELRSTGSFAVLRKGRLVSRTTVETGTLDVRDNEVTVAYPTNPPETLPVKAVAFVIDQTTYDHELQRLPGWRYGWNGTVTAGASFVRSTNNGSTFNGALALVRAIPTVPWLPARNRTTFNMAETYGKLSEPVIPPTDPPTPDTVVKTNIYHTDAERDEYFTQRGYGLVQMAFDHNFAQGLQLSQSYGGGVGWTLIKQPKQQLDVKGDMHYLKQTFQTPASNQNLVGSTLAEVYVRRLPRKMVFNQNASLIPAWNNLDAYAANINGTLLLPVFKRFS